ncbi:hypothetical protein Tco_0540221 [Tanacetum coccineum]
MASKTLGSRVPATSTFLSPRTRGTLPLVSALPPLNLISIISRHLPPDNLVPIISRRHVASCHWTAATYVSDSGTGQIATCRHVTATVIDGRLSEVVLGKPFMQASKLTYDESLGSIRFAHRVDEVVFRMPQRTKELDLVSPLEKDKFEAFFVEKLMVRKKGFKHVLEKRKGYYKACMNLRRTYKRDREAIEKLKTNHISIIKLKE